MRLKHFTLGFGLPAFKALADENRLRMLFLIWKQGPMCTTDLELILDFTQTKTNRHLSYLKNSGLLTPKRTDQYIFFSLTEEYSELLNQILHYLEKDTQLLADQETFKVLFSNRELALNKIGKHYYNLSTKTEK
jgi:ArsR family transcriptional regulator, arsenate/arsenite/antimonite-responsive transcriptional repressor